VNNFIQESFLLDPELCNEIIGFFKDNPEYHTKGKLILSDDHTPDDPNDNEVCAIHKCSTDISFNIESLNDGSFPCHGAIKPLKQYFFELNNFLQQYLMRYRFANAVPEFRIRESINIQWYKPYEGFRGLHHESSNENGLARYLVFFTYLNTVKDGPTEFLYHNYMCEAIQGKMLICPAGWTHTHRGVISPTQDKYVMTGWFSF